MNRLTSIIAFILFLSATTIANGQDTTKKEYHVKYEVLTKKGVQVSVGYFDKDGKNAGTMAGEQWTYSFVTTDKNQQIQLYIQRAMDGRKQTWVKVNIYINDKLVKSVEDKFWGAIGTTVQVNLNEIK